MTAERIAEIEHRVGAEELALLLAAPPQTDLSRITDPIALAGTQPVDEGPAPMPPGLYGQLAR
jgi:hypothetical protein